MLGTNKLPNNCHPHGELEEESDLSEMMSPSSPQALNLLESNAKMKGKIHVYSSWSITRVYQPKEDPRKGSSFNRLWVS